jgi:ribosome-associated protein
VLLDVREICSFADYFVICSGESQRQLGTIHDEIIKGLKKSGELPVHDEGTDDSGWLLLDYVDVVIHIFGAEEREYYRLEELWNKGRIVLRLQ